MLTVEILSYKELPDEEKENVSNDGHGKEVASYIRVVHYGKQIALFSDAMEPENARFWRDLNWIGPLLQQVYDIGRMD